MRGRVGRGCTGRAGARWDADCPLPCILGLWGAVLHKLTDRARGVGCGPFRIGRGGAGSDLRGTPLPPACEELRGVAVLTSIGMDDRRDTVSGRPSAPEA